MTAVVVYNWLLNFQHEVRVIWSRRLTGAKILFLANQYLFMALFTTQIPFSLTPGASNAVSRPLKFLIDDVIRHFLPEEVRQNGFDHLK